MRLLWHELKAQQKLFWRSREAAFFTFALPIILLVLLGTVYGDEEIDGVDGATFLLAGLIGYGVAATAFAGLATTIVVRREAGLLKRVRGTPLPASTYLAAVILSTLVVIALQAVTQIAIGRFLLDAEWPDAPLSLGLAVLLGAISFAALGLAITGLVRSDEGSSAVVNAIYLPLTFISGVFFSVEAMPELLEWIARISPLTYLLDLVRAAFVEGEGVDGSPGAVAILLAWGIVGLVFAVRMFRWEPREA